MIMGSVVAQWLLKPEVRCSNPGVGKKIIIKLISSDKNKEKKWLGMAD